MLSTFSKKDWLSVSVAIVFLFVIDQSVTTVWRVILEGIVLLGLAIALRYKQVQPLDDSTAILQTIINAIPQYVYWKDTNSIYLGGNQHFAELSGVEYANKLVGMRDRDMPWQAEADFWRDIDSDVVNSGKARRHQIHKSDHFFPYTAWLGTNHIPLHNSDGTVVGVLGLISDITERRQEQRAVNMREANFRAMLSALPDTLVWMRKDGYILDLKLSRSATGEQEDDLANRYVQDVYPEEHVGPFLQAVEQALATQETTIFCPVLDDRYWEIRISPSIDDRVMCLVRDVTETRRAQQALQRRDAILEAVGFVAQELMQTSAWQAQMPSLLARLGKAATVSRVYVFENQQDAGGNVFSGLRYEWVAEGILPQVDDPRYQNMPYDAFAWWRDELSQNRPIQGILSQFPETKHLEAEQSPKTILLLPIFVGEQWWGLIGFNDHEQERVWPSSEIDALKIAVANLGSAIERAKTQERLLQTQKLESIGLLAGGIAHDFNNLLTGIMAQASLALAKMPTDLPSRKHIERSLVSAERAADLTRQLLSYAGKGQFETQPIDLNHFLQTNVNLLKTSLPSNVVVALDLDPSLNFVDVNKGQLQQVVMNLIINAGEAMQAVAGKLDVTTRNLALETSDHLPLWGDDALPAGNYVCMEVKDNGIGMDEGTLRHIFDPYFTTKGHGQGLGLSATLGIIRAHGGGLQVKSVPDKGTCFRLFFPATADEPLVIYANGVHEEGGFSAEPQGDLSHCLLIIDDEDTVREAVRDILQLEAIDVVAADCGQEGIKLYEMYHPKIDAVLLDMKMPGMDGVETYTHLREIDPRVQVILSSGYHEVEISHQFEPDSIAAFLEKPYNIDTLIQTVHEVMGATAAVL